MQTQKNLSRICKFKHNLKTTQWIITMRWYVKPIKPERIDYTLKTRICVRSVVVDDICAVGWAVDTRSQWLTRNKTLWTQRWPTTQVCWRSLSSERETPTIRPIGGFPTCPKNASISCSLSAAVRISTLTLNDIPPHPDSLTARFVSVSRLFD